MDEQIGSLQKYQVCPCMFALCMLLTQAAMLNLLTPSLNQSFALNWVLAEVSAAAVVCDLLRRPHMLIVFHL